MGAIDFTWFGVLAVMSVLLHCWRYRDVCLSGILAFCILCLDILRLDIIGGNLFAGADVFIGAGGVVLLKPSLDLRMKRILLRRGQRSVITRVFLFLKSYALRCLLSIILGFESVRVKRFGALWAWVSNEWFQMSGVQFAFLYFLFVL